MERAAHALTARAAPEPSLPLDSATLTPFWEVWIDHGNLDLCALPTGWRA